MYLNEFDHLERDLQRDGDQIVVEDDEGQEAVEEVRGGEPAEVVVVLPVPLHELVAYRGEQRDGNQDQEEEDDLVVRDLVDRRALQGGLREREQVRFPDLGVEFFKV